MERREKKIGKYPKKNKNPQKKTKMIQQPHIRGCGDSLSVTQMQEYQENTSSC